MKILFVNNSLDQGGIETFMIRIASHVKEGELSILLFSKVYDIELLKDLKKNATVYFLDDFIYGSKIIAKFPFLIKVILPFKKSKLIKEVLSEIDHIHAPDMNSVLFANRILSYCKKSITYSLGVYHINEYNFTKYKHLYFVKQFINLIKGLNYSNFLFFNEISRNLYASIYSQSLMKCDPVPIGIELKKYEGNPVGKKSKRIVSIGRLSEWKTYNYHMILTLKYLKENGYDFYYDSYGDGVERNNLEKVVKKLGLENEIKFHPSILYKDFKSKIADSLLFIGAGTALIEASACGIPALIGIENLDKDKPFSYGFLHQFEGLSYQEIQLNLPKITIYNHIINLWGLSDKDYLLECNLAKQRANDFDISKTIIKFVALAKNSKPPLIKFDYLQLLFIVSLMTFHKITNQSKDSYFKRL